jgi:hypothetical protein
MLKILCSIFAVTVANVPDKTSLDESFLLPSVIVQDDFTELVRLNRSSPDQVVIEIPPSCGHKFHQFCVQAPPGFFVALAVFLAALTGIFLMYFLG